MNTLTTSPARAPRYTDEEILANRKEWTDALRSGEHKQARGRLGNAEAGFCCLGVASQIAADSGAADPHFPSNPLPPHSIAMLFGLSSVEGHLLHGIEAKNDAGIDTYMGTLVELNDEASFTFAQIADVIDTLPITHHDENGYIL